MQVSILKTVVIACILNLSLTSFSYGQGHRNQNKETGTVTQIEQKKGLFITTENWIEWHKFNGRIMFYYTHLQSFACGIQQVTWGISETQLDNVLPIIKCDEARPYYQPKDTPTYSYLDEIQGVNSEQIKSIFIQVVFYDGIDSFVHEFPIPPFVLKQE